MTTEPCRSLSNLVPKVIARLPEPNNGKPEYLTPNTMTSAPSSVPLNNEWQRRRLALDAFCPAIQVMADAVQAWCFRLFKNALAGRCLVLAGPFGMGKTSAMRAARRYTGDVSCAVYPGQWAHPIVSAWANWPDFIRDQDRDTARDQMEDLATAHAVFLDDIGAEEDKFKSGAPTRILADLLGKIEGRFSFITTNIEPNGWRERWDRRVEDRLLRDTVIVNLWEPNLCAGSHSIWKLKTRLTELQHQTATP